MTPFQNSATTELERKRGMVILFCALLAIGMGQNLFTAILPPIARDLGMSEIQVSSIFSLSAIIWMLMSPIWGNLSDRIGRKPVIMIGICGFGISTGGFGIVIYYGMEGLLPLTILFPLMISVRAIFGTFGSGTMPAAQAYIADRTTREQRSSGVARITASFGVGTIIGPGIAAALITFGILTPFFAVAAMAFTGAIAVLFLLPERTKPAGARKGGKGGGQKIRFLDKRALPFVMMSLGLSFAQSIQIQVPAFYFMDTLGFTTAEAAQYVGVGLMAMAMAGLFSQLVVIQIFNPSVQTLMRAGALCSAAAFLLLVYGGSYSLLVMGLTLSGLGFGLLRPGLAAAASLSVSPNEQGSVAGVLGSTHAAGHVLMPIIGMPLYKIDPQYPFLVASCLSALAFLFIILHPKVRSVRAEMDDEESLKVQEGTHG